MCVIYVTGTFSDPEMRCDNCDMWFIIAWGRNLVYSSPEFCPFCGDAIDEFIEEYDP